MNKYKIGTEFSIIKNPLNIITKGTIVGYTEDKYNIDLLCKNDKTYSLDISIQDFNDYVKYREIILTNTYNIIS